MTRMAESAQRSSRVCNWKVAKYSKQTLRNIQIMGTADCNANALNHFLLITFCYRITVYHRSLHTTTNLCSFSGSNSRHAVVDFKFVPINPKTNIYLKISCALNVSSAEFRLFEPDKNKSIKHEICHDSLRLCGTTARRAGWLIRPG